MHALDACPWACMPITLQKKFILFVAEFYRWLIKAKYKS